MSSKDYVSKKSCQPSKRYISQVTHEMNISSPPWPSPVFQCSCWNNTSRDPPPRSTPTHHGGRSCNTGSHPLLVYRMWSCERSKENEIFFREITHNILQGMNPYWTRRLHFTLYCLKACLANLSQCAQVRVKHVRNRFSLHVPDFHQNGTC